MNLPPWTIAIGEQLSRRLQEQSMPHALLLLGGPGLGRRALARWLCQRVLCAQPDPSGDGCGRCRSCELLASGTHPDFLACAPAEGKQQITVDQIRELIGRAALTRSQSGYQVFLIEQAEKMNANAANALLKTLEEPTPGTLLVLLAERRDALPPTVISRCQVLSFGVPDPEQALAWLRAAHSSLATDELRAALSAGGGSPGVAEGLIAAGASGQLQELGQQLVAIAQGRQEASAVAAQWVDEHLDHRLRWMSDLLRELIWGRLRGGDRRRIATEALEGLTAGADLDALFACFAHANRCRRLLSGSLRKELLIEDLLLVWQRAVA